MIGFRHRRRLLRRRSGAAGFTLLETLVAVTLMGMILTAVGMLTAQWMPGWNRGFMRVQRGELFSVALNRLASDLSAAEFVTPNRDTKLPLFEGTPTGVILTRSAIGPNTEPGLEVVRLAEASERQGIVLVRTRTRFAPFGLGDVSARGLPFTDPVVLLRAPFRVTFSYSSGDGGWKDTWQQSDRLPAAVRFLVRDTTTGRTLAISSATMVHVDLPVCSDSSAGATGAPGSTGAPGAPVTQGAPGAAGAGGTPGSTNSSGCNNTNAAGSPPSNPTRGQ